MEIAAGIVGKWHLGQTPGRFPIDQGFDEWLGIPTSSDESFWPDNPLRSQPLRPGRNIMQGLKGGQAENLRVDQLDFLLGKQKSSNRDGLSSMSATTFTA